MFNWGIGIAKENGFFLHCLGITMYIPWESRDREGIKESGKVRETDRDIKWM